jgi:hypothetical protein
MQKGVENGKASDARVLPKDGTRGCEVIEADTILLINLLLIRKGENRSQKK